jgi:hypothetical protein
MKSNYLIDFDSISKQSIAQVKELLKLTEGIKIKDCLISDLVFHEGEAIYSGNGVYVFKSDDIFIYVGCCVARNFVERIPAHFDLRKSGWFNSLLQNIINKKGWERTNDSLAEAGKIAMDSYSLILINFPLGDHLQNISDIKALETLLRRVLNPYNSFKKQITIDSSPILVEYLRNTVLVEAVPRDKKRRGKKKGAAII